MTPLLSQLRSGLKESLGEVGTGKGEICTEYRIWCGICQHHEFLGNKTKVGAAKSAKIRGWRKNNKNGWVCKDCLNAIRAVEFA